MRRVLVVVALIACERAESVETPPEPQPVPVDAAVDCVRDPAAARRLVVLDAWRTREAATRRTQSPIEAPIALTRAYISLEFAYAYARLGDAKRASVLRQEARAALKDVASDPVHGNLLALYGRRIDDATRCAPAGTPTPELEATYASLDRVARYKVDRLLEQSRALTHRHIDALSAFSRRVNNVYGDQFEALRRDPDPKSRARTLDKLVDTAPTESVERGQILAGVVEATGNLPPDLAKPLLGRVLPLASQPPPVDWTLLAAVLVRMAPLGGASGRAVATWITEMKPADRWSFDGVLLYAARELRGHWDIVRMLLAAADKAENRGTGIPLGIAAGHLIVGNQVAAAPILAAAHAQLGSDELSLFGKLDLTRTLILLYTLGPLEPGLAEIQKLFGRYDDVTDSFGTNSHFNLSAVAFNSMILQGIVGE